MNFTYQMHLLQQAVRHRGQDFVITRQGENEFHEPEREKEVLQCPGLFHEANGYLGVSLVDAGKIYTQKEPKILIMYTGGILKGDMITDGRRNFKITGIDDLGNLHLCLDLSLEAVE